MLTIPTFLRNLITTNYIMKVSLFNFQVQQINYIELFLKKCWSSLRSALGENYKSQADTQLIVEIFCAKNK